MTGRLQRASTRCDGKSFPRHAGYNTHAHTCMHTHAHTNTDTHTHAHTHTRRHRHRLIKVQRESPKAQVQYLLNNELTKKNKDEVIQSVHACMRGVVWCGAARVERHHTH